MVDGAKALRKAEQKLRTLADSLAAEHPGATESLREGLTETPTLTRLGVGGALFKKICPPPTRSRLSTAPSPASHAT